MSSRSPTKRTRRSARWLGRRAAKVAAFSKRRGLDLGEALDTFARRANAIVQHAPAMEITFEAGFGRPLDYYTGVVFELRAKGIADPLVGGGRYDRLMRMLGAAQPIPAVGFTMRLDLPMRESAL